MDQVTSTTPKSWFSCKAFHTAAEPSTILFPHGATWIAFVHHSRCHTLPITCRNSYCLSTPVLLIKPPSGQCHNPLSVVMESLITLRCTPSIPAFAEIVECEFGFRGRRHWWGACVFRVWFPLTIESSRHQGRRCTCPWCIWADQHSRRGLRMRRCRRIGPLMGEEGRWTKDKQTSTLNLPFWKCFVALRRRPCWLATLLSFQFQSC